MKQFSKFGVAACCAALLLQACGGGGGGGSNTNNPSVIPPVAQTPNPGPPPVTQSATCPSSGPNAKSAGAAVAQSGARGPVHDNGTTRFVPGLYTVTYATDADARTVDDISSREGARPVTPAQQFSALGLRMRAMSIDPARAPQLIARLKQAPGVIRVEQAQYRHMTSITADDPYYRGFGAGAPYYASASTPGQWDMHIINVGTAWSRYSSAPVRGAAIAIIDTGVDVTHPDLSGGKVIRQHCFVTYPSGSAQTTGSFAIDTDGHGTNVAGIADADTNNNFGFAGVAFDAPLLAYRIFPTTPSGGCEGSSSAQCSTTSVDEASAINDAVSNGARVINLSLGATPDSSGNCTDSTEYNAVEAAIAHGVVVVAAAGNESKSVLDCPAQYPGVIAAGAEGPSGSNDAEAVASYSNWVSGGNTGNGGAYLVAPGGTANDSSDTNDLHYVENITSSEMANASAYCKTDFAGEANDCRGGFAGSSQATPHVAGVASLILGLKSGLTPRQVASAICSSAHSIGDSKQGCGRLDAGAAVAKALTL